MFVDLAGVRVYYEQAGAGSPVILLHGWGGRAAAMRPFIDWLGAECSVVALDFPGFGQSALPPTPWGVGDYARSLVLFLDTFGLATCAVVGHSFGGRVAIKLAATAPERVAKLVLVDSAGLRPRTTPGQSIVSAALKCARLVLSAPGLGAVRGRAERMARARLGSEDYREAGPLRETFVRVIAEDLRPLLPQIRAPTLLLWGELDDQTPVSDARIMEREIPDSGLVVLRGAGHFCYLDRPADACRVVRSFLAPPGRAPVS